MCQQAFTQVGTFKAHLARHTGLKPFSCEICGKAFPVKQRLIVHLRVHSGEKPVRDSNALNQLDWWFYWLNSTRAPTAARSSPAAASSSSTSAPTPVKGRTSATSATSASPVQRTSKYSIILMFKLIGFNESLIRCTWGGTPARGTTRARFAARRSPGRTACASTSAATTAAWSRSSARCASARSRATSCSTCARTPTRSRSAARRAATASPSAPSSRCTWGRTLASDRYVLHYVIPLNVHSFKSFEVWNVKLEIFDSFKALFITSQMALKARYSRKTS